MERLERFKKAVEYLKPMADEATNEGVSRLLRYNTDNYISDVIGQSKPINKHLLNRMVEYSINPEWINTGKGEMVLSSNTGTKGKYDNQLLDVSTVKVTLQDYIDLLKSINSKEEERNKEMLKIIKELAAGQKAISETLTPIKEKTEEILTNSNTTLDRLSLVETIMRSDDTVIMNNQDRQNGNAVGTSAKEAGSRQLAADKLRKGKGSHAGVRKNRIDP